jgi:hypothetical protein
MREVCPKFLPNRIPLLVVGLDPMEFFESLVNEDEQIRPRPLGSTSRKGRIELRTDEKERGIEFAPKSKAPKKGIVKGPKSKVSRKRIVPSYNSKISIFKLKRKFRRFLLDNSIKTISCPRNRALSFKSKVPIYKSFLTFEPRSWLFGDLAPLGLAFFGYRMSPPMRRDVSAASLYISSGSDCD